MMAWLKTFFRSRYVLLLEEEVARLRAENRALLNSLLGTAGHPPLDAPVAVPARLPVGRRSWHQIMRANERQSEQRMIDRHDKALRENAGQQTEAASEAGDKA